MAAAQINFDIRQGAVRRIALRSVVDGVADATALSVEAREGQSALSDLAPTGFVSLARSTDGTWILTVNAVRVPVGDYFWRLMRADGRFLAAGVISVGGAFSDDIKGSADKSRGDTSDGPTTPPAGPTTPPAGPSFTQEDKDKLAGIQAGAQVPQGAAAIRDKLQGLRNADRLDASAVKNLPSAGLDETQVDGRINTLRPNALTNDQVAQLAAAVTKLAGIEDDATADQTGAEIARLLENLASDARLSYTSLRNRLTGPQQAQQLQRLTGNDRDDLIAWVRDHLENLMGGARFSYDSLKDTPQGEDVVAQLEGLAAGDRLSYTRLDDTPSIPAAVPENRQIPAGGTDGQVLAKTADTDYAVGWEDAAAPSTGDAAALVGTFSAIQTAGITPGNNLTSTFALDAGISSTKYTALAGSVPWLRWNIAQDLSDALTGFLFVAKNSSGTEIAYGRWLAGEYSTLVGTGPRTRANIILSLPGAQSIRVVVQSNPDTRPGNTLFGLEGGSASLAAGITVEIYEWTVAGASAAAEGLNQSQVDGRINAIIQPFIATSIMAADVSIECPVGTSQTAGGGWSAWTTLVTSAAVTAAQAGLVQIAADGHAEVDEGDIAGGGDRTLVEFRLLRRRGGSDTVLSDHVDYPRAIASSPGGATHETFSDASMISDEELAVADTAQTGDVYRLEARAIQQRYTNNPANPEAANTVTFERATDGQNKNRIQLSGYGV